MYSTELLGLEPRLLPLTAGSFTIKLQLNAVHLCNFGYYQIKAYFTNPLDMDRTHSYSIHFYQPYSRQHRF